MNSYSPVIIFCLCDERAHTDISSCNVICWVCDPQGTLCIPVPSQRSQAYMLVPSRPSLNLV
uniref:Uncharacterized protein n=1 Tax=Anguilla anguilla TaxID=7936 RepID=A0A0E9WY59_ANGAN